MIVLKNAYTGYNEIPSLCAKYSSTYSSLVLGNSSANSNFAEMSFNSGSTPDEIGIVWVQPFNAIVASFRTKIKLNDTDRDVDIILYNSSNDILETVSIEADKCVVDMTQRMFLEYLVDIPKLQKGKTYRLVIKPTTVNSITMLDVIYPDVETRLAEFGFGYRTERTDGGSWTDTTTEALELTPVIGDIITGRIF